MPAVCPYCDRSFPSDKVNARHLSKCNPSGSPAVPLCVCGHTATSMTQMKRHRQVCPDWLARDAKQVRADRTTQTCLDRYGVPNAAFAADSQDRRQATNLERYGAANVFAKGSTLFDKVQQSLEGKRGAHGEANAFAHPEVQAKIRQHWLDKHGVSNPQQVAAIRTQTKATNLERYGHEQTLAVPAVRVKIRATCEQVYGGPAPSCSLEVVQKQRQTNLDRYGVEWTAQDPEVRRKQLETMEATYGSHYFASDQGKAEVRSVLRERYGVENPAQMEGFWGKAQQTFRAKYGVDYPLQLEYYNEKRFQTCVERYGTPFPGLSPSGPNRLEQKVASMTPMLSFTGNGAFWKRLPLLGVYKNPDFIMPGPDPAHPKKDVTKVVEVFGDFWHSRIFTGKANFDHEQELVAAFADIGIDCLILWESEIKQHPARVAQRLHGFLGL